MPVSPMSCPILDHFSALRDHREQWRVLYRMRRLPHPRECFFEQAVLQHQVRHAFLQIGKRGLTTAGYAASFADCGGCQSQCPVRS